MPCQWSWVGDDTEIRYLLIELILGGLPYSRNSVAAWTHATTSFHSQQADFCICFSTRSVQPRRCSPHSRQHKAAKISLLDLSDTADHAARIFNCTHKRSARQSRDFTAILNRRRPNRDDMKRRVWSCGRLPRTAEFTLLVNVSERAPCAVSVERVSRTSNFCSHSHPQYKAAGWLGLPCQGEQISRRGRLNTCFPKIREVVETRLSVCQHQSENVSVREFLIFNKPPHGCSLDRRCMYVEPLVCRACCDVPQSV